MDYKKETKKALKNLQSVQKLVKKLDEAILVLQNQIAYSYSPTPDLDIEALDKKGPILSAKALHDLMADSKAMEETLPLKNRLRVGTWYKYEGALDSQLDKNIVVFYKGEGVQTYGQWSHNGWLVKATIGWDFGKWVEATYAEIEKVLIAEANRKYTGKSVKYLKDPVPFESLGCKEYIPSSNALRANYNGLLVELFRDGEWAEVVEDVRKITLFGISNYSERELKSFIDQLQMELKNRK